MKSNISNKMVSVIIPCFNQGIYIDEAIDSVLAQTYKNFEIIIVNDGSTDKNINRILKNYRKPNIKVINTNNQGVAQARNNGIKISAGAYILPLDADDKIGRTYLEKAVKVLDQDDSIGIVYCKAEFFGAKTGEWNLPEFKFPEFLLENCIFCTSMFRRDDFNKTNGYNPNMIYGLEDFDFWLSFIEFKKRVYRIPETLFYYRIKKKSRNKSLTIEQMLYSYLQLLKNHRQLYVDNVEFIFQQLIKNFIIKKNIFKISVKIWKNTFFRILIQKRLSDH